LFFAHPHKLLEDVMKKTSVTIFRPLLVAMISFSLIGILSCSDGSTGLGSDLDPITDEWAAKSAVQNVADCVRDAISGQQGNFSSVTVHGTSGTAVVSGTKTYTSGISCGADCVRSETDIDVTVVFNGYTTNTASNQRTTVSGTVSYRDTRWSRQSGLSYSSGGKVYVDGANIAYESVVYDESTGDTKWGYSDTITFDASGGTYLDGWCVPNDGNTYSF
jgi:hypothetical protein